MVRNNGVVHKTILPELEFLSRGKVRDIYDLGNCLLMVSTDRLSAFDVVMNEGIPDKGKVLTGMTEFWLDYLKDIVPNHLITADVNEFSNVCPKYADALLKYANVLAGRSMIVKKANPLSAECIVRGYITGSGWKDYKKTGSICGIEIPAGMKESEMFPEPLFTPSTKADIGDHDANISFDEMCKIVGENEGIQIKDLSIKIYKRARDFARERGIIIADTKLEFGFCEGEIILIDEVLTPDSSRFWPANKYEAGRSQESFDKQFVRDFLNQLSWDKNPPPPALPEEIINETTDLYLEAYKKLTGKEL